MCVEHAKRGQCVVHKRNVDSNQMVALVDLQCIVVDLENVRVDLLVACIDIQDD